MMMQYPSDTFFEVFTEFINSHVVGNELPDDFNTTDFFRLVVEFSSEKLSEIKEPLEEKAPDVWIKISKLEIFLRTVTM